VLESVLRDNEVKIKHIPWREGICNLVVTLFRDSEVKVSVTLECQYVVKVNITLG
jgi:hypothetical protein